MEKVILIGKSVTSTIKKNQLKIIIALSILYPFFLFLSNILSASIPFWFDPARDFFLALDNISKLTLIGPPSGIPGIFYGPYWIWMISIGLVISKDPRLVAIIVCLLPYFTVFPFILFKFTNIYDKKISLLLWLLFIFSFQTYTTFIWNPHLAPLFFLILTYLLISFSALNIGGKYLVKVIGAGIVSGLLFNFHMSFGLSIFIASIVYLGLIILIKLIKNRKNILYQFFYCLIVILLFIIGFLLTLIPYIVFELRHNFLQSRVLFKTITDAVLYNSASVGQTGLNPREIVYQLFIERTSQLLSIRPEYILAIYFIVIGFIIYQLVRKKISFTGNEKNIILFSVICLSTLYILFTSSKNPVWQYHFISVEIIIMLLTGIALKKWGLLRKAVSLWVTVIVVSSLISYLFPAKLNPLTVSSLATKKYIVELVYKDVNNQPFSVFTYSPAIYTYDFDYIFKWLGEDVYHELPEQDITKATSIYLIIPKTSEAVYSDFINWKTPDDKYVTFDKWVIPDGTTVVKRVLSKK